LLGDKWDSLIKDYIIGLPEEEEIALYNHTCFEHPAPHNTYLKHIWGSELIENRYFSFLVSDAPYMTGPAAEFKPHKIYGRHMGPEWDDALRKYWRMRDHVRSVRQTSTALQKRMPERFPGPNPWLQYYDSRRDDSEEGKKKRVYVPKPKLRILPPRPPPVRPKRRRMPSDLGPEFPASAPLRTNHPPTLPPAIGTSRKEMENALESVELAGARAAYNVATPDFDKDELDELVPDDELSDEDEKDSGEKDASGSDDDDKDAAVTLPQQQQRDEGHAIPEQRRDSGGSHMVVGGGKGKEPEQNFYTQPGIDKVLDLPPLPPLPLFCPPISSSEPPQPPPSPRPQTLSLPPSSGERKRKFRVIDLDADPDLDEEDYDSDDDSENDEDDESDEGR